MVMTCGGVQEVGDSQLTFVGVQQNIKKKASGPALGNGFEILLQGFNWESCKKDWYKVSLHC